MRSISVVEKLGEAVRLFSFMLDLHRVYTCTEQTCCYAVPCTSVRGTCEAGPFPRGEILIASHLLPVELFYVCTMCQPCYAATCA